MASERGGRADKLGNEFERLWAVRHLIELVAGTSTTFRMEALGDDEKGAEFWVGRPDGTREAHQCKRENGAAGKWSVADLASKQIIENARFQLGRDPNHRFVFASADKANHLSTLADRAGRCDTPAEFVTYLATTSGDLRRDFDTLCRNLGIVPSSTEGAAQVVDFLRRFRPEDVNKLRFRSHVEELSARWIAGEPGDVVAALKDLLDESIGRTLSESDVIARLPSGARPRDLARDPTLRSALDGLRDRFADSYRHLLIGGRPLGRKEAADLVSMLTTDEGPRLVLLHGRGGDGKSGVAFEVVEQLRRRGIPCLPLRLDRDRPGDSPSEFGRSLGLPASPTASLAAASEGGMGVLVLDQVDAIRWTAAHSSHAWDTCERMVSDALGRPNLRAVVVCRSFDLDDDPRIKAWKEESKAAELKVGPLDDGTVAAVIAARGLAPESLDSGQREVLRSPQGLYLWLALHERDGPPPAFRTMTDLMRRFWDSTRRKLAGLKAGQYDAALEALVEHMDRRGVLAAPRTVVERWPEEVAALLSLNVLVEGPGGRLLFSHQSSLDYCTACRVLRDVHAGTGTVRGWLAEDDQSLFRRGQLRQLLSLLRDEDPGGFLETMRDLLHGDGVRFHLRQLAVRVLGHSESPTDEEVELVLGLLERPEWVDHVFFQVLAGREPWFDALYHRGILRRWSEGSDESRVNLAIAVAERVVETRGEAIESLFLDRGRERWPGRLASAVWRTSPEKLTDGLFDAVIDLRRRGEWVAHDFVNWKVLAEASPSQCLRMLEARIGRELDALESALGDGAAERRGQNDASVFVEMASLVGSAAAIPLESWDRLMPCYLRASKFLSRLRRRSRRGRGDHDSFNLGRSARRIRRVLREVLTASGRAMARDTTHFFWDRVGSDSQGSRAYQRLIDRILSHGPDDRADAAIRRLLSDRSRFRSGRGDRGRVYLPAWRILRRYSGVCSEGLFAELQAAVLTYWPTEERDEYRGYHDRKRREAFWGEGRFDVLRCNDLGLGQYVLLSGMPRGRLNPDARDRLGVLHRKFGAIRPLLKTRPRDMGGWVGTTIPDDRLPRVSDRNWLGIIHRDWSRRPRHPKQMGPDRLGEVGVETFARDLGRMAALQPARFARLALRIPVDSDPRYPVEILGALAGRTPPSGTLQGPVGDGATIEQIEAVVRRFARLEGDRDFAMAVCRAIEQRHDGSWSDDTIDMLSRFAIAHPDPRPGEYAISRSRNAGEKDGAEGQPDVAMSSINCVRGAAAKAIEAVLFGRPELLLVLQPAVDSLLDDPHPAVRAAAVGLALPLYNIDRSSAVDIFLRACSHPDDGVLQAYDINNFLRYTIIDHAGRLRPLIERMVGSRVDKVAKAGAAWGAVAWSYQGLMDDIAGACVEGTPWQRMGVAEALSNAVAWSHDRGAVLDRLRTLFDDPDKRVRDMASRVFRSPKFYDQPSAVPLAEAFLLSRALDDNVDDLLHGLEGHTKPLMPYASVLCRLADRFSGPLAAQARDHRTRRPLDAGLLAKVMLRLYEQSEHNRALRRRCLDAWDGLLREGLGYDVLQHVDR